jgi:hypothetical protein
VRALALTLALAALPALANAADPPATSPPPRSPPASSPPPASPPKTGSTTDAPETAGAENPPANDPDFQADVPAQSLALGPLASGTGIISMDVGWLRSAARLDVGVASFVGFFFSADTMLLYRGVSGETSFHGGLRVTPITEGSFRVSIEGSAGEYFIPVRLGSERYTQVRGDLLAGYTFDPVTVYGRVGLLGASQSEVPGRSGFVRQEEFGAGVETAWRKFVFGVELWGWSRPDHPNLGQWRLRAGIVL